MGKQVEAGQKSELTDEPEEDSGSRVKAVRS
jgi:hypothetical protein